MKKLLAVVLLLCLLCPCALAAGKLQMTEVRVVRDVDGEYGEMMMYLQITNTGDEAIGLDHVAVSYVDANGAVVCEESGYGMYPSVLQPGEKGYTYIWSMGLLAEEARSIVDYHVTIREGDYYMPQITHIPHEVEYQVTDDDFWSEHHVLFSLTNTSNDTLWRPYTLVVVRSTEGKILTIQDDMLYNVGVPSGSSLYCDVSISMIDTDAWKEKGYEVGSVETYVYTETETY